MGAHVNLPSIGARGLKILSCSKKFSTIFFCSSLFSIILPLQFLYDFTGSSNSHNFCFRKSRLCDNGNKTDNATSASSSLVENQLMVLGDEKVNSAVRFLGDEEAENSLMMLGDADVFKNLGMRLEGSDEDKKLAKEDDDSDSVILLSDDDDDDDDKSVTVLDVVAATRKRTRIGNAPQNHRKCSQSEDDSIILLSDDETDNSLALPSNEEVSKNLKMCEDISNEISRSSFQGDPVDSSVILNDEEVDNSLLMFSNDSVLKNSVVCEDVSFDRFNYLMIPSTNFLSL